jgi:hypothetical protein
MNLRILQRLLGGMNNCYLFRIQDVKVAAIILFWYILSPDPW